MNLGIKISTLASIALFSASASAVNFDEATAMGGAGLDLVEVWEAYSMLGSFL